MSKLTIGFEMDPRIPPITTDNFQEELVVLLNDPSIQWTFENQMLQQNSAPHYNPANLNMPIPPPQYNDIPTPELTIVEQPRSGFRYRYVSEEGSHGKIMGENYAKDNKSTVKLRVSNFEGQMRLRAILYTDDKSMRHIHKLQGNNCKDGIYEETYHITNSTVIEFSNLTILHEKKKSIPQILTQYVKEEMIQNNPHPQIDERQVKKIVTDRSRKMKDKLHTVRIKFEAVFFIPQTGYVKVLEPIFSTPISNEKNPNTSNLVINHLSHFSAKASGGETIIILCSIIKKNNIWVRFFDESCNPPWEVILKDNDLTVHHQYGIVFKVPPYRDLNIDQQKTVFLELVRPKDRAVSGRHMFYYKPEDEAVLKHKRLRKSIPATFIPTSSSSDEGAGPSTSRPMAHRRVLPEMKIDLSLSSTNSSVSTCPTSADILEDFSDPNDPFCLIGRQVFSPEEWLGVFESLEQTVSGQQENTQPGIRKVSDEFEADGPAEVEDLTESMRNLSTQEQEITGQIKQVLKNKMDDARLIYRLAISAAKGLHGYATQGNVKKLLFVLKHLIPVQDENGDNSIHLAVINSQLDALKQLLEILPHGSDALNAKNKLHQTPLHQSIYSDEPEILSLLLGFGCDPTIQDKHGNTPVHSAAHHGKDYSLEKILKDSVIPNLDLKNYEGFSALHLAVMAKSINCVKHLCKAGADVNIGVGTSGKTALHLAVEENNAKIVKFLLEQNCNVNAQSFDGSTALHLAIQAGLEDIVKLLLEAHADPYIENGERYRDDDLKPNNQYKNESADEDLEGSVPSDDDDSDEEGFRGHTSFDLARDKNNILLLLQAVHSNESGVKKAADRIRLSSNPNPVTYSSEICVDLPSYHNTEMSTSCLNVPYGFDQRRMSDPEVCSGSSGATRIGKRKIGSSSDISAGTLNDVANMDDRVKQKLADLLDPPSDKDWQAFAVCTSLDWLITQLHGVASPMRCLLDHIPNLDALQYGLEALDAQDALKVVIDYRKLKERSDNWY